PGIASASASLPRIIPCSARYAREFLAFFSILIMPLKRARAWSFTTPFEMACPVVFSPMWVMFETVSNRWVPAPKTTSMFSDVAPEPFMTLSSLDLMYAPPRRPDDQIILLSFAPTDFLFEKMFTFEARLFIDA